MLLDRKRLGLVLRVFAKTPEQVEKNVAQAVETVHIAQALEIGGKHVFAKILVLIPADTRHIDADCGHTKTALAKALGFGGRTEVHEFTKGDVFCGILNYATGRLLRAGIDYMTVLSHEARAYLRQDVMETVIAALDKGAKVAGVALAELSQSILEGRVANTHATWDLQSLTEVGCFDLRAAQARKDDPTAPYLRGWSEEKQELFYPRGGVEEVIPLLRLVKTFGPCIAPIVPTDAGVWQAPDPQVDPDGHARFTKKMGTKLQRQMAHAIYEGADLDCLKGGVMPDYRRF